VSFLQKFIAEVRRAGLFDAVQRRRVLVACSGGADSLLLLHALWAARHELKLQLAVLTCDHGLRAESAAEATLVQQIAWGLALPCRHVDLAIPTSLRKGESVEMCARRKRREAYVVAAAEFGSGAVALGHHRDDQAETLLLRLCRGTGTRGAAGIRVSAELTDGVDLIRPLLGFSRAEIEAQCRSWRLPVMHDLSNADPHFLRNRVRHDILPLLHACINPETSAHLAAFAEQQARMEDWVNAETLRRGKACRAGDVLLLSPWRRLPELLRERLLFDWLMERGSDPQRVDQAVVQRLCEHLAKPPPTDKRLDLAGLRLRLSTEKLEPWKDVAQVLSLTLLPGQSQLWPPLGCYFHLLPTDKLDTAQSQTCDPEGPLTAFVRPPDAGSVFQIRHRQSGDRYCPMGLHGSSKVSDLFINAKIPLHLRERWPILVCGDEIVWVPGFRVAENWKAQQPILKAQLDPMPPT
jgi:tRNA(Ile)-lysidine synthetase-like protein